MTETRFAIRRANKEDIPRLLDLYQHLIPGDDRAEDDLAIKAFEDFVAYAGSAIFIGEIDNKFVASCVLVIVPNLTRGAMPYGLIENVVTHVDHRQRGYGRKILDVASDAAWSEGCYKVMLMTGSSDNGTLLFYLKAGFKQSKTGYQKRRT